MRSMRMLIWSVFKEGVVPEEKAGTKEREGNSSTRAGHVTPSFLTDGNYLSLCLLFAEILLYIKLEIIRSPFFNFNSLFF